jgi:hypothetical protein
MDSYFLIEGEEKDKVSSNRYIILQLFLLTEVLPKLRSITSSNYHFVLRSQNRFDFVPFLKPLFLAIN